MSQTREGPYREATLRPPPPAARRLPLGGLAFAGMLLLSACCYGAVFAVLALALVAVGLCWAMVDHARGRRSSARQMATTLAIVAAGALAAMLFDRQKGAGLAVRNERLIIPAVDRFRADHGRYPGSLEELVPRYLPSTRPAGTPLPMYRIQYSRHGDDALLVVTVMPPFGRRTWGFKSRSAVYLD